MHWHAIRSACIDPEVKGQGHTVTKTARLLVTRASMGCSAAAARVGLHVDTTAYAFYFKK